VTSKSPTPWRRALIALSAALSFGASEGEPPPAEQLRRLEETGLRQAREAVRTDADLLPFAFVVRSDGRTQKLATRRSPGLSGAEIAVSLIEGLRSRAKAGAYRAVSVFRFVRITLPEGRKTHAIQVGLEHVGGRCEEVFLPYHETSEHEIRFEPALRRSRSAEVFPRCDPRESAVP
jgi:hypothetical protein